MGAREVGRLVGTVGVTAASAALCGVLVGAVWQQVEGDKVALWLVARAAGASAFLLLTVATLAGIVLSHPGRARLRWPAPSTRLRLHVSLTVFALAFTVLHIVVLAVDPYAKVGWQGALLPMSAAYRPVPVTIGVISMWAGVVTGLSAALAGRVRLRWWRALHRLAALSWMGAWAHAVLAGSDSGSWTAAYVISGLAVLGAAWWRYAATGQADTEAPMTAPTRQGQT